MIDAEVCYWHFQIDARLSTFEDEYCLYEVQFSVFRVPMHRLKYTRIRAIGRERGVGDGYSETLHSSMSTRPTRETRDRSSARKKQLSLCVA